MSFDLPRGIIFPVEDAEFILQSGAHPFEIGKDDAIAANWAAEKKAKPALFNGAISLLASMAYRDGRLRATTHLVPYATFLYWRKTRAAEAEHCYAHAVLVTADNALVAIRMAQSTVNAGLVYFAAGSFEEIDFIDGRIAVELNMEREVGEETGIDLSTARSEPGFHALSLPSGTVIFKRYVFVETADAMAARVNAHFAAEDQPEIDGVVIIRSADDLPDNLAAQMPQIIRWHFANPIRA